MASQFSFEAHSYIMFNIGDGTATSCSTQALMILAVRAIGDMNACRHRLPQCRTEIQYNIDVIWWH